MTGGPLQSILHLTANQNSAKEVNQLPNPLAIGVTFGGLLLDAVVPRPKPRAGFAHGSSLLSEPAVSRTPRRTTMVEEHDGASVAGFAP